MIRPVCSDFFAPLDHDSTACANPASPNPAGESQCSREDRPHSEGTRLADFVQSLFGVNATRDEEVETNRQPPAWPESWLARYDGLRLEPAFEGGDAL